MLGDSCTKNKINVANFLLMQVVINNTLGGESYREKGGTRWDGTGGKDE